MLLKLVPANLAHLRDVIDEFGPAWIHGDGNVYLEEQDSNFHFKYSNPLPNQAPSAAMYRAKFNDSDDVPDTCKELEEIMLQNAKKKMEQDQVTKNAVEPRVVKAKRKIVAPEVNPLIEKEAELSQYEEKLGEKEKGLSEKEGQIIAAAKTVTAKSHELAQREAELAERETKIKEMEARLAALQPKETEKGNPAGGPKPPANK
jgi:hypothetical protein